MPLCSCHKLQREKKSLFALENRIIGPFQMAELAPIRAISDTSIGPIPNTLLYTAFHPTITRATYGTALNTSTKILNSPRNP